jgi:hypothetical protein
MSFNMSGGPAMNGLVPKGGSFGGYGEFNGHAPPSQYYGHDAKPQIYTVREIWCAYMCDALTSYRLFILMCPSMRWK